MDKNTDKDNDDKTPEQPRQPKNLQGLLKFAMEATSKEDPTGPTEFHMDEEKRKFLEDALKDMTVDVKKEMLDAVKILNDPDATESDKVNALEVINDLIDSIDNAILFQQLMGFDALIPCLNSKYESVRAAALLLVADLVKNNQSGQLALVQLNIMSTLTNLLTHPDPICTNAMSAISSLVTNYDQGVKELFESKEIYKIVKILETRKENRLITKVTFFLSGIPGCHPDFVDKFLDLGIMKYLSELIVPVTQEELQDSQILNKVQNILHATANFCTYNRSIDDLRIIAPDLSHRLKEIVKVAATDEAFSDIQEYAEKILKVMK
uniref:Putative armadillo/beta-catenin-like repeat-containing protein n=1 Tax=Lutzomyia longipalpis TaxID=7200 RepID=A0A1B0C910_LUTLO